jgi:hypothetical protein
VVCGPPPWRSATRPPERPPAATSQVDAAAARAQGLIDELHGALQGAWAAALDALAAGGGGAAPGPRALAALRGPKAPALVAEAATGRVWVKVPAWREVKVGGRLLG